MAFSKTNLSAMAYGDGQTWWQYKNSGETLAQIKAANHFDAGASMIRENDLIYAIGSDGVDFLTVTGRTGTTVVVSGTAI